MALLQSCLSGQNSSKDNHASAFRLAQRFFFFHGGELSLFQSNFPPSRYVLYAKVLQMPVIHD